MSDLYKKISDRRKKIKDFIENNEKQSFTKVGDEVIKGRQEPNKNIPVREIPFMPSTIETIDFAVKDWVDGLNIFTTTNEGFKKVPILWVSPERSFQMKHNKELHDKDETLKLPLITINRTSIIKDPNSKGSAWGNVPPVRDYKGGSITISRRIQQEKTSNFANADSKRLNTDSGHGQNNFLKKNKKIVYETVTIPMPVYVDVMYSITLRTEYQEQMNDLMTPFITMPGGINFVVVERDGHRFDSFVQQDFVLENNIDSMGEEERSYKTKVDLKVLGHLIGEGKNQEKPKIVIRENAVEVKIPRERVIYGDIPEHIDRRGFYKE